MCNVNFMCNFIICYLNGKKFRDNIQVSYTELIRNSANRKDETNIQCEGCKWNNISDIVPTGRLFMKCLLKLIST